LSRFTHNVVMNFRHLKEVIKHAEIGFSQELGQVRHGCFSILCLGLDKRSHHQIKVGVVGPLTSTGGDGMHLHIARVEVHAVKASSSGDHFLDVGEQRIRLGLAGV